MKKTEREIYRILANEVDFTLCSFCKFVESVGSCCEDVEQECHHPLWRVNEDESENAQQLGDCWGFCPKYKLIDIVDIVGIMLSKGWQTVGWGENKEGRLEVYGVTL